MRPELRRLLSLPKDELEKVLEAAASAASSDYEDLDVNLSETVQDLMDYPPEQ